MRRSWGGGALGRGGVTAMAVALVAVGCLQAGEPEAAAAGGQVPADTTAGSGAGGWYAADWEAFSSRVRAGLDQGWDTLPLGATVAAVGRTFVGTPYVPQTLEAPGPEGLVINFRGLDCVTFVETALATAYFLHQPDGAVILGRRREAEARYEGILTRIRYRGGVLEGYGSRLHYFSDWIADGVAKGLMVEITPSLAGAARDATPVSFMSRHPEAYPRLDGSPDMVDAIRGTEERLSAAGRWVVPEDRLQPTMEGIEDGDVIAVTSTVDGLDVAHTGLALWVDGRLHLMHAPLVGDSVEISTEPLSQRVRRIGSQDGVMVARPCPREGPC